MFPRGYFANEYFGPGYFAKAGGAYPIGLGDIVTTGRAFFRRQATGTDGTFRRAATTGRAFVRRTVTTADTER